jgi:hypothetical protein
MVLIVMTVIVAVLAVYRLLVARKEDDFVHIADPSGQLGANQQKVARTLSQVDRLGIGLTIATAVYGIGLFAMYLYTEFSQRGIM